MAYVTIGGLFVATLLTLPFLPARYLPAPHQGRDKSTA
jgi:Cu/Ag efflux pump CusA